MPKFAFISTCQANYQLSNFQTVKTNTHQKKNQFEMRTIAMEALKSITNKSTIKISNPISHIPTLQNIASNTSLTTAI